MHNIIKFFSKKKYLDEFISGKLHMNTLDYFWNNGFEDQKDIFEGVVCTVPVKDFTDFQIDFQTVQSCDYRFRAEGYKYCNVLCFYKLNYSTHGNFFHYEYNTNMEKFGQYVAFITNEGEFLRRVGASAEKKNYKYLCGDVRYHEQMLNGNPRHQGNQLHISIHDRYFTLEELTSRGFAIKKRDCFDKGIQYQGQNEWRVALYRGEKNTEAYKLDVGDLSDIIRWFSVEQFQKGIAESVNQYRIDDFEGWYGNISRRDMRESFYELGEQKTTMFATIG